MSMRKMCAGLVAIAVTGLALVAPTTAYAQDAAVQAPQEFPSADSTVVASTGFLDGEQIGWFWSAARGDSVTETFSGKNKIKKATLELDVPINGLAADSPADWAVSINDKVIGDFTIEPGVSGPMTHNFKFKKIKGGEYTVRLYMTNEVRVGGGSHTLRYAGAGPHSITLK